MYMLSTVGWMLSAAILALSLGHFAITLPRQMQVPRGARFAIGVALTPYVIGAWVIVVTTLVPGAPRALMAFGAGIVATPYLLRVAPRLWHRILVAAWRGMSGRPLRLVAVASGAVLLLGIMQPAVFQIAQPVSGSDASHYLAEAKGLANTRDFRTYTGFEGAPDGSVRATTHGPSFSTYLASPLAANAIATGVAGPRQDLATRIALVATFVLLFVAVYALASSVSEPWLTPPLTISIFLTTWSLSYILVAASRDPFRITPMLCLIALLTGQLRRSSIRRRPASVGSLLALSAAAVVSGHSLALVELPAVMAAWLVAWTGRLRKNIPAILLVLCAVGAGAALGGSHYAAAYYKHRSLTGDNTIAENALVGTPYEPALRMRHDPRVGNDLSPAGLVVRVLSRDPVQLLAGTFLACVLAALFARSAIRRRPGWAGIDRGVLFAAVATVAVAFVYLVAGQLAGSNLTYSAAVNFRYVFLWNVLASLMIAVAIVRALAPPAEQRRKATH